MKTKKIFLYAACFVAYNTQSWAQVLYTDITQSAEVRAKALLSKMTLAEKIGQMAQIDYTPTSNSDLSTYYIGSVLNGGGTEPYSSSATDFRSWAEQVQAQAQKTPHKIPILYGIDAVHGHSNVVGATIFPHNIGLGCMNDTSLIRQMSNITANEVKATGMHWTFAPCMAVSKNEKWGRSYESYSENTELVTRLSAASISAYQDDNTGSINGIMACAKHFIGDGATDNGKDQGNAIMNEKELREKYLPPYQEAVKRGVASVMVSYNSWNGQKCHGIKYLITDVLKVELGFDGIVVSDWAAVDQLIPTDYKNSLKAAINAGIDMVMLPNRIADFTTSMKSLVSSGEIPQSRIDDAVLRILKIKFKMGLFEKPLADKTLLTEIGSKEHREVARACVSKSMVLLKNENSILPLKKSGQKIHLFGSHADDIGLQCGGWTISWQGGAGATTTGTTILEAFNKVSTQISSTSYGQTGDDADVGVFVFGEIPYAEMRGDNADLEISSEDLQTIIDFKSQGKPVVAILLSGRPLIIDKILPYCDAFVAAWLIGSEGDGVADLIFGDVKPSGKLSFSWPKSMNQIPINEGDVNYDPLFPIFSGFQGFDNINGIEKGFEENIIVHPNPTNNYLFVKNCPSNMIMKLINQTGQNIDLPPSIFLPNEVKLDLSNLQKGLYLLIIEDNAGNQSIHKIVKQ